MKKSLHIFVKTVLPFQLHPTVGNGVSHNFYRFELHSQFLSAESNLRGLGHSIHQKLKLQAENLTLFGVQTLKRRLTRPPLSH